MPKIILITHQKGGVGKSTLTFNLAVNLVDNAKVCIVDMDYQGSLNKVRELCRKMIEQDYNAYGITDKIVGELIGLRYIPVEKKKGTDIKKYISSEIFYGQYDILICDLGNYSKEDIQTEICIEPDVYIYADDAEISVYSEEESKVFKKIKGIPEQYIIELLTRE